MKILQWVWGINTCDIVNDSDEIRVWRIWCRINPILVTPDLDLKSLLHIKFRTPASLLSLQWWAFSVQGTSLSYHGFHLFQGLFHFLCNNRTVSSLASFNCFTVLQIKAEDPWFKNNHPKMAFGLQPSLVHTFLVNSDL